MCPTVKLICLLTRISFQVINVNEIGLKVYYIDYTQDWMVVVTIWATAQVWDYPRLALVMTREVLIVIMT